MEFVYVRYNTHCESYRQHLRDFRISFVVFLSSVIAPPLNGLYFFSLITGCPTSYTAVWLQSHQNTSRILSRQYLIFHAYSESIYDFIYTIMYMIIYDGIYEIICDHI